MRRVQLVGTQRSGSNLLRLLLGSLPDVFAPPSAHKLRDFQDLVPRYGRLRELRGRKALVEDMGRLVDLNALRWPRIPGRTRAVLAEMRGSSLAHAVLAFYDAHARHLDKDVWVCKCLENVHLVEQLAETGLPILYVHLVRDPRDVAASFLRAPIGPKDPQAIALRWLDDQEAGLTARGLVGDGDWLTLRYEDLVADPEKALKPLCDRLVLPWSPRALEFHRRPEARSAAALSELWANLDRPIRRDRVAAYRESADPEVVRAVEDITRDQMPVFGYQADRNATAIRLSAGERELVLARDRRLRAKLRAKRDPETEAVHMRRSEFLDQLRADPFPQGETEADAPRRPTGSARKAPLYVQFAQKAVIEWEGKLLLVKKSQDDPHQPGKWELPGGRLLQNESPDEALVREVREEVGLEVDPGRPLAVWSWRLGSEADAPTVVAIVRHCTANDVAVDMSRHDEDDFIDKYAWFDRDSILGLDLIPSAREPLAMALANL
ncbi:8-oxo-dGTP pyrophosphatase MutT (NUDIX family) [Thermocatellispora tengchongensis]|uniref:8-oxo-dGTP pyrophosphatase MutT (NUDIX family) n=1 Tax=Thermocatellispora tengchongensis TaxID=1073253 RepID=A0A840NZR6_9ACTN|nr:sulfotransferase [Thermocatellispora tengchongensis]MBB5132642.1 8-oxo-dGTP pyrophosphatase MutT (NUDIX family) [Thermocatellispora tengchongensis]